MWGRRNVRRAGEERKGGKKLTGIVEAPSRLLADSVASIVRREIVLLLIILGVGEHRVVVVVRLVLRLPGHFVLLLEASPRVREPSGDLRQRHLRDDSQHNLLAFRRVRVLLVLIQPSLQGCRRLPRGILPPRRQVVAGAVPEKDNTTAHNETGPEKFHGNFVTRELTAACKQEVRHEAN